MLLHAAPLGLAGATVAGLSEFAGLAGAGLAKYTALVGAAPLEFAEATAGCR